ncbi:MAG: putative alpha-dextrin endo-1, 6-alpha-glucosidase [uncultured Adhaeribacter sp.]|uniref:Putative alpha-dextrin endo-1, 6-alpha-glucosidase n=1 Tax=uncultured Adhaeribacter sp. TaxID=448109 RepID=A0A6J4IR70_9BACT|nr:MAG: putative alpha-dextrin endo-1, 6-alpha-glucosidase [uncultured Adhaeribacter sp.]
MHQNQFYATRLFRISLWICLHFSFAGFAQMRIIVKTLPAHTPAAPGLFLVGNFNKWQPGLPAYQMHLQTNGSYELILPPADQPIEFKVTRGTWETVETAADGSDLPNRVLAGPLPDSVTLQVANWADLVEKPPKKHTATPQVHVLDAEFPMTELGRTRRIWLYVPVDYNRKKKKYPVLYLHDGQNLFDAYYSYSGEWGVDETLDTLARTGGPQVIVVGIDNGGEERINELTPYANPEYGGGDGEKYLQFIVQ